MENPWDRISLTQRFTVAAGLIMVAGMAVIGNWVEGQIKQHVTETTAVTTALMMEGILAPFAAELADNDTLSVGPATALIETLSTPALRERMYALRLWKQDGLIAFSTDLAEIGQTFEPSFHRAAAYAGNVRGAFDPLLGPAGANESEIGMRLFEVYTPIRQQWTGEVIAVAQIFENADVLAQALDDVRFQSWLVVGLTTLGMAFAFVGVVHSGSRLVERQQAGLREAMAQNSRLLVRIAGASGRSSQMTEQQLRRVSADLHDGPAQLVSLAALRVGSLDLRNADEPVKEEVATIQLALNDALKDIRDLCRGLSLPEIEDQDLIEVARSAIRAHISRHEGEVSANLIARPLDAPAHVKTCVFRFLQEGLNNAARHGSNGAATVTMSLRGADLIVTVSNPWNADLGQTTDFIKGGLGIIGLRERVESLGGDLSFERTGAFGARLEMRWPTE